MLQTQVVRFARKAFSASAARNASCLVIAEHDGNNVTQGTLATVTAASKIGGDVTMLVAGAGLDAVAKAAGSVSGVSKVLTADSAALKNNLAEPLAAVVARLAASGTYSHVLTPSSNISKNFFPRAAAIADVSPLMDVSDVISEDTFKRPMYAGNAIATVKMSDKVKFLIVRPTSFEKANATGNASPATASPVTIDAADAAGAGSEFVSAVVAKSDRPDLTAARVVVSGGRAMKDASNFPMIFALADKLKGAVGASRAAVDAGYISNEHQVGQTGKVVAPELYIAAGISGAIQHVSGMKDSKVIVAINKDKEAPIFQIADYGLVEDLFKAVPDMTSKL